MSDYVPKTKDFTNAPLCLSGHCLLYTSDAADD